MEVFYKHIAGLIECIEDCLTKRHILPCLTLLYSGIDVISSLEAEQNERVQESFMRWVDAYLLKAGTFRCSALDLYAARCAIVHTFTAQSDLSRSGKARKVYYAWGTADEANLDQVSQILGKRDVICVHVQDLIDSFRIATANYLEEVEKQPERQKNIECKAGLWFTDVHPSRVDMLLALHDSKLGV
jgi:hypothetical protein